MNAHPLADLFPLIEGEDFSAFVADIKACGQREPIVTMDGMILDGRNRYRACLAAGIEPRFTPYTGDDPLGFVLSLNLRRRHLNETQRALVAARLAVLAPHRPRRDKPANLPAFSQHEFSQDEAAARLNVSPRLVRHARVVLDHASASIRHAAERGLLAVSAASQAARLSHAMQDDIAGRAEAGQANAVRTAIKQGARTIRERALGLRQQALPERRYGVIYADPEWRFVSRSVETGMDRAPDNHYPTSDLADIAARDVRSIAAEDCVLFLWATMPMLPQALHVLEAWGFAYKSHVVWTKDRIGLGYWARERHELLLIGVRGAPPPPAAGTQADSVFDLPRGAHSAKPDAFAQWIGDMFPTLPKIELNRRGPARDGWDAWGNEAEPAQHASAEDAA